jgi:hypothetical protein
MYFKETEKERRMRRQSIIEGKNIMSGDADG